MVILKAGDRTYADLLREVKEGIKKSNNQLEVNRATKNKDGNLVLSVEGGREAATKMNESITQTMTKTDIIAKGGNRTKILHIRILDDLTNKECLQETITSQTGEKPEEITIKSLGPAWRDTQNATVEVDHEVSKKCQKWAK